jgi:hypothetical protein
MSNFGSNASGEANELAYQAQNDIGLEEFEEKTAIPGIEEGCEV